METKGIDLKVLGLILFSVSCGVMGQLFFKKGMVGVKVELGPQILEHFLKPDIIVGICFYAIATTSWLVILSKIPLSLAYPLVSISYFIIVLVGRFYFHEAVSIYTWMGVVLICSGVGLIGFGNRAATATAPPPATAVHAEASP